jgi:hypothetical protein
MFASGTSWLFTMPAVSKVCTHANSAQASRTCRSWQVYMKRHDLDAQHQLLLLENNVIYAHTHKHGGLVNVKHPPAI